MKKYQLLAQCFNAWKNCIDNNNEEWRDKWQAKIDAIISTLPHGSGIDGETNLDYDKSIKDMKLIINSEYHAMDENGTYDCWIDFRVVITPSLQFGADISIKGQFRGYGDSRECLQQQFYNSLMENITDIQ